MATDFRLKVDEALKQITCLEEIAETFARKGESPVHRQLSSTLRTLLLGSSGKKGLVPDVLPGARLLAFREMMLREGYFFIPGPQQPREIGASVLCRSFLSPQLMEHGLVEPDEIGMYCAKGSRLYGAFTIHNLFKFDACPVPISTWLKTPILTPGVTVEDLIRYAANKGGGTHFEPNQIIRDMDEIGPVRGHILAAISEGIVPQLRKQLTELRSLMP